MDKEYYVIVDGKPLKINPFVEPVKDKYEQLCSKLADIRNLFDESDMEAEGHGMEDMISDPYAVACYAESKIQRLMQKKEAHEKALKYYADRGFAKASEALE